jgi:uncharacterized protein YdeI (YjbR/CyaY-like superfamily)
MNRKVDHFLALAKKWQQEMILLRSIVLECGLDEDYKWMHPCYSLEGKNIVLIHQFKEYCALLFFKGVLMKDPKKILIQQTENVQDRRQLRFTNLKEIEKQRTTIKAYIKEAIAIESSGQQVVFKKTEAFAMPDEFQKVLKAQPAVKAAFEKLTPGRQRGYLLYFAAAKQSATRTARITKYLGQILKGKGLNDQ